jgi:phage/plasmid-associated DNA primase
MDKPDWWRKQGELPGMLRWALAGLHRLRQQGRFTTSAICEAELEQYRRDCNPAAIFLAEHYKADPDGNVVTQEMYDRYAWWCQANGFYKLASNSFGREIVRAFPTAKPSRVTRKNSVTGDDQRFRGYTGIAESLGNADGEDF